MAAGDLALNVILRATNQTGGVFAGLVSSLGPVGLGLAAIGAGAIATGVAAVKMAADFQQSTNLLITSAGESAQNIGMIRSGLLQMSVDTATPVSELVKGMFNIESAGYHGAQALMIEKAAAEGAKVENANLAAVTDVLTTSMHNYNLPASQAVDVMNSFRLSASIGKMRMDDLTGALRNVLPIASQAHVSLTDVEAALSTMSLSGDKGASAGTHLSQMLTYLLAPSSKATKALISVGLTTQQISDEMKKSLPGSVQMITQAVGEKFPVGSAKYIAALSAIVGGNKSMRAMLELSGGSLNTFTNDAKQLAPTMKANSTAVDGWNIVQQNFNFKMDAAKNAVSALLIGLGSRLLPVLSSIIIAITPIVAAVANWITSSNGLDAVLSRIGGIISGTIGVISSIIGFIERWRGVFIAVGSAIGLFVLPALIQMGIQAGITGTQMLIQLIPALISMATEGIIAAATAIPGLIAGFVSWAIAGWAAAAATIAATWPILLIIAAIALLVVGIVLLVKNWSAVTSFLKTIWQAFTDWLMWALDSIGKFFSSVWSGIVNFLRGVWDWIVSAAKYAFLALILIIGGPILWIALLIYTHWNQIKAFLAAAWTWITDTAKSLWDDVVKIFTGLWQEVQLIVTNLVNGVLGLFKGLWDKVTGLVGGMVQGVTGLFQGLFNTLIGHSIVPEMTNGISTSFDTMSRHVQQTTSTMSANVTASMSNMKVQAYNNVNSFSTDAMNALQQLGDYGQKTMQSLDKNTIGYWNDVAAYIAAHPVNAQINVLVSASGKQLSQGLQKNAYASGIMNAPAGWALVGENGPEMMWVPGGSNIYPNKGGNAFALQSRANNAFALSGSQTIVVQVMPATADINMDSRKVGEGVMRYASKELRIQGNIRNH